MKPLGKTQALILRALKEHKSWHRGCGWIWSTNSQTTQLLESLVRRGLVTTEIRRSHPTRLTGGSYPYTVYLPVEKIEQALELKASALKHPHLANYVKRLDIWIEQQLESK